MGFIDYHGTKEDRYDEVLDYAHAQQEEDWKRKQAIKIKKWLTDLTGNGRLSDLYIQDLLKTVIVRYKELWSCGKNLVGEAEELNGLSQEQIWIDFSMEYVMRHIEPFHMMPEKKKKHFDTFQTKIFKVTGQGKAEEFYETLSDNPAYRRYLTECFDPAWKGQQFFKYLHAIAKKDKTKKEELEKFINAYKQLGVSVSVYLYQAAQPRDDGWMIQEAAEWNAVTDIEGKLRRNSLSAPEYKVICNPLYFKQEAENRQPFTTKESTFDVDENPQEKSRTFDDVAAEIPQSKLKKKELEAWLEKGDIPAYVNASLLLMECDLPEEIRTNYNQLIERMPILQDAIDKFDKVYHADMDQFNEYFAPEALKVTATYLDYQAVAPSEKILGETRENVLLATRKLVQVVNEKIDEIYMFVTIETNAEAKALETVMIQDGYVDSQFKIN